MSEVGCRYYCNSECKATNLLDNSGFTTEYFFMKNCFLFMKIVLSYENCFIFMKVVSFLWKLFHFYERVSFLRKSFIFHFTVLLVASIRFLQIFFFDYLRSCRPTAIIYQFITTSRYPFVKIQDKKKERNSG